MRHSLVYKQRLKEKALLTPAGTSARGVYSTLSTSFRPESKSFTYFGCQIFTHQQLLYYI